MLRRNSQTVSAEMTFILAMALWPSVQRKAQAELDSVVGPDRLPTFADVAQMPYLNALYLEILRWNQVVPLGEWPFREHIEADVRTRRQAFHTQYSRTTSTKGISSRKEALSASISGTHSRGVVRVPLSHSIAGKYSTTRRYTMTPSPSIPTGSYPARMASSLRWTPARSHSDLGEGTYASGPTSHVPEYSFVPGSVLECISQRSRYSPSPR